MTIDALQFFLLLLYTTNYNPLDRWPEKSPLRFEAAFDKYFFQIREAAQKYQVESRLQSMLEYGLERHLTVDNCLDFYGSFRRVCSRYIASHFKKVVTSESFLMQMKRNPEQVHDMLSCYDP